MEQEYKRALEEAAAFMTGYGRGAIAETPSMVKDWREYSNTMPPLMAGEMMRQQNDPQEKPAPAIGYGIREGEISQQELCSTLGISVQTLCRFRKRMGITPRREYRGKGLGSFSYFMKEETMAAYAKYKARQKGLREGWD